MDLSTFQEPVTFSTELVWKEVQLIVSTAVTLSMQNAYTGFMRYFHGEIQALFKAF